MSPSLLKTGFFIALSTMITSLTWTASEAASMQPKGWKALLIAGDDQEPAFDNAVAAMAAKLASFGVPQANMIVLRATSLNGQAATTKNIKAAFARLDPAPSEGCFVFITSHGAPGQGLVIKRDRGYLSPGELGALLNAACAERPTAVIASGCYSGSFAEGPILPSRSRVILTAARDDRPSFGCNAERRFTVFDGCVLESLIRDLPWTAVMEKARSCVIDNERKLHVSPPSAPQISVGANVLDLRVFPPAGDPRGRDSRP